MNTAVLDRLSQLGDTITTRGVAAVDVELLLLAHDARDRGVEPVLVDVMVDLEAPSVVRERAFARVAARLTCLVGRSRAAVVTVPVLSSPVGAGR